MSREILFRAKTIETNEWVFGNLIPGSKKFIKGTYIQVENEVGNRKLEEVDPNTVGQFTGLLSEDGSKVFEGDIVSFERSTGFWTGKTLVTEHEVYFEPGICAFVMRAPGTYIKLRTLKNRYIYKIVGNIFDK